MIATLAGLFRDKRSQRAGARQSSGNEPSDSTLSSSYAATTCDSSSQLLTALPPVLLALICQYLPVAELLCLLRCCSHLRTLNTSDATFSSAAWSSARLHLALTKQLHDWTLPLDSCIQGTGRYARHIPLSLWQQAVPVIEYTVQHWYASEGLKAALHGKQPATKIVVKGEQHVVLSKLSWGVLNGLIPQPARCFRSRFVLAATPHLQHLSLAMGAFIVYETPLSDIVCRVPRLRSLRVERNRVDRDNSALIILPNHTVLAHLPHLTALSCASVHLSAQTLIDIAAHATLEHIHLENAG